MVFTSFDFLIFLSLLFPVYFLFPQRFRWVLLLAASGYFYSYLRLSYLVYLIVPTLVIYGIAVKLEAMKPGPWKKLLLFAGVISGLACLLLFKYADFIGRSVYAAGGIFGGGGKYEPFNFILPIGISFYSFKLVSYIIDVYHERLNAERHIGYFTLYVSFFPQLLAGPIDRAVHFIPQLKKKIRFDYDRVVSGLRLTAWGFFKKLVIADQLAAVVNQVYGNVHNYAGVPLIAATIAYTFQIYCDFSGYSDIAIGVSRIFGFKSMKNFDSPYSSTSIVKFWNNWHISLTTWLRDYLFLPIAYAVMGKIKSPKLAGIKAETWGYAGGMFITMFLGGLWHGARWTFVLWGSVHGIFLIFSYITKKTRKRAVKKIKLNRYPGLHKFVKVSITFGLVAFAWIFFRADSISDAFYIVTHLHTGLAAFIGDAAEAFLFNLSLKPAIDLIARLGIPVVVLNKVIIAVIIMEGVQLVQRKTNIDTWFSRKPLWVRWSCYYTLLVIILYWGRYDIKEFIYFQF